MIGAVRWRVGVTGRILYGGDFWLGLCCCADSGRTSPRRFGCAGRRQTAVLGTTAAATCWVRFALSFLGLGSLWVVVCAAPGYAQAGL